MKNKYLIKSRNSWANADYEHIIEADSEKDAKEIFRKENRGLAIMGFPKLVNDDQKIGSRKVLNEAIAEEMLYEIDNSGSDAITLKEGFGEKTEFSREDLLTALPHLQKNGEKIMDKKQARTDHAILTMHSYIDYNRSNSAACQSRAQLFLDLFKSLVNKGVDRDFLRKVADRWGNDVILEIINN